MDKYNFHLSAKDFSARVECHHGVDGLQAVMISAVVVTIEGVEFDIIEAMPMNAWEKLHDIIEAKLVEASNG